MRPSFTTLAGMTIAAGSIAFVGASLVAGGTASAQVEPVYAAPAMQIDVLESFEVGDDAEVGFANQPGEDYSWIDDDGCPPCGMG